MSDDTLPSTDDLAAVERLREDVARLRLEVETEVRTRRVVVMDASGADRIRLTADDDVCRVVLIDPNGFERLGFEAADAHGVVRIAGRTESDHPSQVDVFALDPEDDQGAYVGVELVDQGNSVAGFTVVESRPPRTWTMPH
ncbi:MAG TPA: hypothetical protein VEW93_08245 [Acidimicrobiales bacterium]|nr:hypothetical protein [Acidimicrobiales bacterium]